MKYLSFVFLFVFFVACESGPKVTAEETKVEETVEEVESEKPVVSQEEMERSSKTLIAKVIDASSLKLELNQGEKWVIATESYTPLMKIKQQIYIISGNMENYEISSYNEMGAEFLDFVKTIPALEDEAANIQFQKVVNATKEHCLLMLGGNLQHSQVSVINLSIIYEEVPAFFEPIGN